MRPLGRKVATFGLICFAGLAAGMVLRAQLQGTPDRAEAAAKMFEDWCIARLHDGSQMPGPPLEHYSGIPGEVLWVDTGTGVALELTAQRCSVSDVLAQMTLPEQDRLLRIVVTKMELWAPELTEDPTLGQALPGSRAWISPQGQSDPQRWGIVLLSDQGQDTGTSLSLRMPRGEDQ